jgi:hypothetical protein
MPRTAHHRAIHRTGPHHSWVQRKAYHLGVVLAPARVGLRIRRAMRRPSTGIYQIPPGLMLEFLAALDRAEPYATDESGEVWE